MLRTLRSILISATIVAVIGVAAVGATRGTAAPTVVPAEADAALLPSTAALDLDALLAADQPAAKPDRAAARGELRRLAAWRKLVHATVVVDLPDGGLTTFQVDHGSIGAVDAGSLTIAEAGGGSVTVKLDADARIRRDGKRTSVGELKTGDQVFVVSKIDAGSATAVLVVVPKA